MAGFGQQGKVGLSFPLTVIGILAGALGIALVTVATNPVVEIISGVIVAVGVALVALSKHLD